MAKYLSDDEIDWTSVYPNKDMDNLWNSCSTRDISAINSILHDQPDLDLTNKVYNICQSIAALGYKDVLEVLLEHGNLGTDKEREILLSDMLSVAANNGRLECVQLLVEYGADIELIRSTTAYDTDKEVESWLNAWTKENAAAVIQRLLYDKNVINLGEVLQIYDREVLALKDLQIGDEEIKVLCLTLEKFPILKDKLSNLKTLDLSKNEIGTQEAQHLIQVLQKFTQLEVLNLSNNNIGEEGCTRLSRFAESIGSNLKIIDHPISKKIEEFEDNESNSISYDQQSKNIIYEAKGDKSMENQDSIKELLQGLIRKPENDWIKQVILRIKAIHNNIYSSSVDTQLKSSYLELVKEFLIQASIKGEIEDSTLNNIFKNNEEYQDSAMDLILSLANNFSPFQNNPRNKRQEISTKPHTGSKTPEVTREEDLIEVRKVQDIIQDTLTDFEDLSTEKLLQNLYKISSSLKSLAWNKDDATCIRNIHGYRTHKDGSNDKNAVGAKLNFDVLSKLGELSKDVILKNLLIADKNLLRSGLESLNNKIQTIISDPILQNIKKVPTDNTQTQIGFLENISAFYNDYSDIVSLINLCEESKLYFQSINNEKLMSSHIEKYYLGRLFVKIGETAKSISDYIKPQASKNGANDMIRTFFGALKKYYRDTVKGKPELLYSKTSLELLQMKLLFEEALNCNLIKMLVSVKTSLLDSLYVLNEGRVNYSNTAKVINENYNVVNNFIVKEGVENKLVTFSQNNKSELQKLRAMLKYAKEKDLTKTTISKEHISKKLEDEINKKQKETKDVLQQLAELNEIIGTDNQKTENASTAIGKFSQKILKHKAVTSLKKLIDKLSEEQACELLEVLKREGSNYQDLFNAIKNYISIESQVTSKLTQEKFTKIIKKLPKQFKCCEESINKIISDFKKDKDIEKLKITHESVALSREISNDYYHNLFKYLKELKSNSPIEYSKACKPRIQQKCTDLEAQLELLRAKKEFVETSLDNILPRLQEYKSNVVDKITVGKKSGAKPTKMQSYLKSIIHEIDFLKELYSTTGVSEHKIEYALEASIGIIGECCRKIKDSKPDELVRKYLNALLDECINCTIEVRNHHIMHNATTGDQDIIRNLADGWLIPLQRDFEALKIAHGATQNLIVLSSVFARLGKYDAAIGILQECYKKIKNGAILNPINYEELTPQTEAQKRAIEMFKLIDTLCPEEIKPQVISQAYNLIEGIKVLHILLDCQLSQQNFHAAIQTADEFDSIASTAHNLLSRSIPGLTISELTAEALKDIDSKIIYCRTQKAFAFDNIGQETAAHNLLKELENDFENGRFDKTQHPQRLARIYTDLASHDAPNMPRYLRKIEDLLQYGTPLTMFNYIFIKFQTSITSIDGNKIEDILHQLKSCFQNNISAFRAEGLLFFDFEMKVKLCELETVRLDGTILKLYQTNQEEMYAQFRQKENGILQQMDNLLPKVQSINLKNIYLKTKIEKKAYNKDEEGFKEVVEQLYQINKHTCTLESIKTIVLECLKHLQYVAPNFENKQYFEQLTSNILSNRETEVKHQSSNIKQNLQSDNLLSEIELLIEKTLLDKFSQTKISTSCKDCNLEISTKGINETDLQNYCKSRLGIGLNDLEYDKHTSIIILNENSIKILRDKLSSQNYEGEGTRDYDSLSYWHIYSKNAMYEILQLRLESVSINEGVEIFSPNYIFDGSNDLALKLAKDVISKVADKKLLVTLNLYNKHWVGIVVDKIADELKLHYLDSEQQPIPLILKKVFTEFLHRTYPESQINIMETELKPQKYNNCGLEVIENFMQYLAGHRLSQEDALPIHTLLYEDSIMLSGDAPASL